MLLPTYDGHSPAVNKLKVEGLIDFSSASGALRYSKIGDAEGMAEEYLDPSTLKI